jgi:uncharacterized protein
VPVSCSILPVVAHGSGRHEASISTAALAVRTSVEIHQEAREMRSVEEWKSVLRAALRDALRTRQAHAVAVMRETLAAIDNAEAAEASAAPPVEHGAIAGGVAGLGAGEVPRRVLSAEAVTAIVEREMAERRDAAITYAALGRQDEASTLRQQIDLLASLL